MEKKQDYFVNKVRDFPLQEFITPGLHQLLNCPYIEFRGFLDVAGINYISIFTNL